MRTSFSTVSRYICRQFLFWFLCILLLVSGFILLSELVEMIRRVSDAPDATLLEALELSLMKTPGTVQLVFHFTVLLSAMFAFWRLTRSQELTAARAAGLSVFQILLPILLATLLIGAAMVGLLNPVAAALHVRYEQALDAEMRGAATVSAISRGGLWLRQRTEEGLSVIYAARAAPEGVMLSNVMVLLFDPEERYVGRIDSDGAALRSGYWDLLGAWVSEGTGQPQYFAQYRLRSDLTEETILDSFTAPEAMSFWALPEFIRTLEETGFSSVRHRLHYNALLTQPVLMAAMVLFAAAFSLRPTRRGGTATLVLTGLLAGFVLFVINDIVMALGLSEKVPVLMAAWIPAGIALLAGSALLLHLEDG